MKNPACMRTVTWWGLNNTSTVVVTLIPPHLRTNCQTYALMWRCWRGGTDHRPDGWCCQTLFLYCFGSRHKSHFSTSGLWFWVNNYLIRRVGRNTRVEGSRKDLRVRPFFPLSLLPNILRVWVMLALHGNGKYRVSVMFIVCVCVYNIWSRSAGEESRMFPPKEEKHH